MKKIILIVLLASFALISNSCDRYLDVNKNIDAPDHVDAYVYLSGIEAAYQGLYWEIRATAPLTQMMGTSGAYSSYALNYYSPGSDNAGEIWRLTYFLQGVNLENMINQSVEQNAWTLAGIGYAIKAFSWDQLTKHQIDLPMKEAFVPGLLSHKYDYQDEIYTQIREWAKKAIEYLEKEDSFKYGNTLKNSDLIYKGDKSKWIKFAHSVLVRNLISLSNKTDFKEKYAQELLQHAALAFQSPSDDATFNAIGGGAEAKFTSYNNYFGVYRGALDAFYQHDFAVQLFTGTLPLYDEATGDKVRTNKDDSRKYYYPYELNPQQILCDTLVKLKGHFDPRVTVKLATSDDYIFKNISNEDSVKLRHYYGSGFTTSSGPISTAPNLYGRTGANSSTAIDGDGRWLYRNDAPYVLMTAAEIQFDVAETYWKLGQKADALAAWKKGIQYDMEFTAKYITPGFYKEDDNGKPIFGGGKPGGDKITVALFKKLADEYLAGPYVNDITESTLTLSHIMMQKYAALYPWGASEVWVDMRKYNYDIKYAGEYPSYNDGWTTTTVNNKYDSDPTKVYKGFYLLPSQVEGRRSKYNIDNNGSPCYRIRPRYNSEYMWNKPSLEQLKPISGTAINYHCSIPWFVYPGDYPTSK